MMMAARFALQIAFIIDKFDCNLSSLHRKIVLDSQDVFLISEPEGITMVSLFQSCYLFWCNMKDKRRW